MALPRVSVVALVLCEHRPQHAGVLVGNRNQCLVITLAFMELPDAANRGAWIVTFEEHADGRNTTGLGERFNLTQRRAKV